MKNQIQIFGTVANAPELVKLQSGKVFAKCRIISYSKYPDELTGTMKSKREWHNVVAWGKKAAFIQSSLLKGRQVSLAGSMRDIEYTNKLGKTVKIHEFNIERVLHLGVVKVPSLKVKSTC